MCLRMIKGLFVIMVKVVIINLPQNLPWHPEPLKTMIFSKILHLSVCVSLDTVWMGNFFVCMGKKCGMRWFRAYALGSHLHPRFFSYKPGRGGEKPKPPLAASCLLSWILSGTSFWIHTCYFPTPHPLPHPSVRKLSHMWPALCCICPSPWERERDQERPTLGS